MDALLNWIWQGSVVAAMTAIVLIVIERARARDRYVTVWAALLSVLALPLVSILWHATPLASLSGPTDSPTSGALLSVPVAWWTSNTIVAVLWVLWSAVAAARLIAAARSLRVVKRTSAPMPSARQARLSHWASVMRRGRRTDLIVSDAVRSAAVLGCGSPTIALAPAVLDRLNDDELDHIVIHEWAHVQRRDDVMHVVQACITVVAGWHPAVWWLDRQLSIEREIACDELAVVVTGSAKGYAASLVTLASLAAHRHVPLTALAAIGHVNLRRRIVRILSRDHGDSARTWRLAAAGSSVSLCVLAMMLGGVRAIEATVEREMTEMTRVALGTRPSVEHVDSAPVVVSSAVAARSARDASPQPRTAGDEFDRAHVRAAGVASAGSAQSALSRSAVASEPPVELIGASPVSGAWSAGTPRALTSTGTATAAGPIVPWREVAAGSAAAGAALGHQSHDAAVASAGYFTRLGKRIASSF